jgi:hypothetical protein
MQYQPMTSVCSRFDSSDLSSSSPAAGYSYVVEFLVGIDNQRMWVE